MKRPTYEELRQRVRELEEEVQGEKGVIADLEGRVRELGEISHHMLKISHQLQEPLDVVTRYLQFVEARYKDRLDRDGASFIESAVDGARRIQDLIDGLLTALKKKG